MTCRIERVLTPDGFVVLRVSGRIDGAYVATLRESMEKEKTTKGGLAIDLTEVTLVSQAVCEKQVMTRSKADCRRGHGEK